MGSGASTGAMVVYDVPAVVSARAPAVTPRGSHDRLLKVPGVTCLALRPRQASACASSSGYFPLLFCGTNRILTCSSY